MKPIKIHFIVDMDEESAKFCPPLGVARLSAYLKKTSDSLETSISFMSNNVTDAISHHNPDILAFSSTSRYFLKLVELGKQLNKQFDIPVVWGGVHISIAPNDLPEYAALAVLGEGEETFTEVLEHYKDKVFHGLENISGIAYRHNNIIIINEKRPLISSLDILPYPDLELVRTSFEETGRAVMLTSRGCPYKCRFCASSIFWDKIRLHSPEYIISEMKFLVARFGVKEILIFDDFFTIDKKRVHKIVELKNSSPELANLKFECLSRVDIFDESLAADLKEMGMRRISFGIESGCQKTLDYLKNGKLKLSQVTEAVRITKAYGMECVGSFVIGSPYETVDEIQETFDFIRQLYLDSVQITVATPFPGTEMWEDGKKLGKIESEVWSDDYYAMFAVLHDTKAIDILAGKKLLTSIDYARFVQLVDEAIAIQNKINLSWKFWIRFYVRKTVISLGLGFLLKFRKKLLSPKSQSTPNDL